MADKTLAERLSAMCACPESVQWARDYTDDAVAWRECQRGDWMLWLLGQIDVDRKRLVLAACGCARLSLHLVPDGEDRPRIAIETAEAWARGDGPTLDDVRRSASAAYASAATYDDAAYAAYASAATYDDAASASYASAATYDDAASAAAATYASAAYASAATYDDAASAAYASAATYDDAAYAAYAASAAAHAASYAASYAASAAYAAHAASAASQCADIVRTHFPEVPHVQ